MKRIIYKNTNLKKIGQKWPFSFSNVKCIIWITYCIIVAPLQSSRINFWKKKSLQILHKTDHVINKLERKKQREKKRSVIKIES